MERAGSPLGLWRGFGFGLPAGGDDARPDFAPRVDVDESNDEVRVRAELPGLDEKEFEVSLDGDVLSIKGEKSDDREADRKGYRHVETARGRFHRALRLPFEVDAESVEARYEKGVLTIAIPKPEEARPQIRAIPVTTS